MAVGRFHRMLTKSAQTNHLFGSFNGEITVNRIQRLTLAVAAGAAALAPLSASALTQQPAQQTTSFTPGALSIAVPAATTFPATALSAGTLTSGVNAAQWSDSTGSGAGWNGTLAIQHFHITGTGAWTPGASNVLANTNSGQYTGTTTAADLHRHRDGRQRGRRHHGRHQLVR